MPSLTTNARACLLVTLLAIAACPARAVDECRVVISHFGDGAARRAPMVTTTTLSVGDATQQTLDWIEFLRNEGPHDIRATFDGAPARQLARNESAPPSGRYRDRVLLRRIECLPARSAALDFQEQAGPTSDSNGQRAAAQRTTVAARILLVP